MTEYTDGIHALKFMAVIPESVECTPEGTCIDATLMRTSNVSDEEVQAKTAEVYGLSPEDVVFNDAKSSSGRSFGFRNWSGSTWEPTGPKGVPSLN